MSEELLIVYLIRPDAVDFAAMHELVGTVPRQDLGDGAYAAGRDAFTDEELRLWIHTMIRDLERLMVNGRQDVETIEIPNEGLPPTLVLVAGGMSYGDDPSDAYTLLSNLSEFPSVLNAGGFQ